MWSGFSHSWKIFFSLELCESARARRQRTKESPRLIYARLFFVVEKTVRLATALSSSACERKPRFGAIFFFDGPRLGRRQSFQKSEKEMSSCSKIDRENDVAKNTTSSSSSGASRYTSETLAPRVALLIGRSWR